MKTRPQLFLLAGGMALALGACATDWWGHRTGVTIHDAYIEIHPGTNISAADQRALERVLRKYDSSLYKIKKTTDGKVSMRGRLEDVLINDRLLAQATSAAGLSNSTLQIGTEAHPDHTIQPNHNNHPEQNDHPQQNSHPQQNNRPQRDNHPQQTVHQDHPQQIGYAVCSELVQRVTPILRKYSHD